MKPEISKYREMYINLLASNEASKNFRSVLKYFDAIDVVDAMGELDVIMNVMKLKFDEMVSLSDDNSLDAHS